MAEILCPTDCEVALPVQKFDECAPEVNLSQIKKVYYAKGNAEPFEDVSDPLEWATRLSQTAVVANEDKIRTLIGIGSKPKPSPSVKEISNGRKITTNRAHQVGFKVDETNQENHDAVRHIQCGGVYTIWYETMSGHLFGGNAGIKVSVDAGEVYGEGNDDTMIYDYVFEWKNKLSEERIVSPL